MKICCTSDLHGYLPIIPECDLLLIAGDICPYWNHNIEYQRLWLEQAFNPWIKDVPASKKIGTWGNHDFIGQQRGTEELLIQSGFDILIDLLIVYKNLKIWGSPWTREFLKWAFMKTAEELAELHQNIPESDIILSHGPPHGLCDLVYRKRDNYENVGSPALSKYIIEVQPKLVVCGHIHCGAGIRKLGETTIINASYVDEQYKPYNPPQVIEIC